MSESDHQRISSKISYLTLCLIYTLIIIIFIIKIPEFDNLYLDMNGIIHTCSHPDDANAHFRITEEQIFLNIMHYIEVVDLKLYSKII